MLAKETLQFIADVLQRTNEGLTAEKLAENISSEDEVSLEVPDGDFYSEDDLKKIGSNKFNEGKKAGVEILIKETANKLGYDNEVIQKDINKLLETHAAKKLSDAKIEPEKKVKELTAKLEAFQSESEKEINNLKSINESLKEQSFKSSINSKLSKIFKDDELLPLEDKLVIFHNNFKIREEDGKQIISRNGEDLRDKLTDPKPLDVVAEEFKLEKKWSNPGGIGDGDDPGKKKDFQFATFEDYEEHCRKNKIELMSDEGIELSKGVKKD